MKIQPIHTLNARGNVMLEVIRDYFNVSPDRMLLEIQGLRQLVVRALKSRNVNYLDLKTALIPDREKLEIALIFDAELTGSNCYGDEVFKHVIPLLDPKTKNSILVGDYSVRKIDQDTLYEAFCEVVCPVRKVTIRSIDYQHSTQFYVVYINNLTDTAFQKLADGLIGFDAFVGCADTTYQSKFKALLSRCLVNLCVKSGEIIIQGHEDDLEGASNVNISGLPFEDFGYEYVSVPSYLLGTFLSYKIESPVFVGFEVDTEFSINAVNTFIIPFDECEVQVEDAKLEYIKSAKSGSMQYAGLEDVSTQELQELIRTKLMSNYIYSLNYSEEHDVTKFNIIIEVKGKDGHPFRLLAALEYKPNNKLLRLITFF